jgi:hypothetical protein
MTGHPHRRRFSCGTGLRNLNADSLPVTAPFTSAFAVLRLQYRFIHSCQRKAFTQGGTA